MRTCALTLLVLGVLAAGCGRELPEAEEPLPENGDVTGAFGEEEGGLGGRVTVAGAASAARYAQAAARGFRAEEPETRVRVTERDVAEALAAVCRGEVDVAGADRRFTAAERKACAGEAEGAVELHVANDGGKPVYLVTTQAALFDSLQAESFLDYAITASEETAAQAGLEPLTVEERQGTETEFQQALAGV